MANRQRSENAASYGESTFEVIETPSDGSTTSDEIGNEINQEQTGSLLVELLEENVNQKNEITMRNSEIEKLFNLLEELSLENKSLNDKLENQEASNEKMRSVTLSRGDNGLFGIHTRGTSISKVKEGSSADLQGIKRGDQIISINGTNVESFSHKEIINIIAYCSGGCSLVLRHNFERLRDMETNWKVEKSIEVDCKMDANNNVDLKKSNARTKLRSRFRSFLFSMIKRTRKDKVYDPAEMMPAITDGNESAKDSMSPLLENSQPERIMTISTGKDGRFGLSRYGTSISRVRKGSTAELQGIKKGDQIVAINDINVETLYFNIVPDQFKQARATGRIRLTLRHNPERLKHLRWHRRIQLKIRNRLAKCD